MAQIPVLPVELVVERSEARVAEEYVGLPAVVPTASGPGRSWAAAEKLGEQGQVSSRPLVSGLSRVVAVPIVTRMTM